MKLYISDPEIEIFQQFPVNASIPWTDIDLTPNIIPEASIAYLRCRLQRNNPAAANDWKFWVRPKGGTHGIEIIKWWSGNTPSFLINSDTFVKIGTDRKIQYKLDFPVGGVEIEVVIWLLGYFWS